MGLRCWPICSSHTHTNACKCSTCVHKSRDCFLRTLALAKAPSGDMDKVREGCLAAVSRWMRGWVRLERIECRLTVCRTRARLFRTCSLGSNTATLAVVTAAKNGTRNKAHRPCTACAVTTCTTQFRYCGPAVQRNCENVEGSYDGCLVCSSARSA